MSRVLNNNQSVADSTRKKVLKAIEELDYAPNPIARLLSIGRTLTIGILLPYLTLPSYIERLRGVQHILNNSEYDLMIFSIDNLEQKNAYFRDLSRKSRVDGMLIVSLPPNDQEVDYFISSKVPTVLIDCFHPKLSCIVADDVEGGKLATRHLVQLGHRRIGFMSNYLETPFHPAMQHRYQGYREVLDEEGIPFVQNYLVEGERDRKAARKMAHTLLTLETPPTAIFASTDTQAIGILDYTRENGIRVPEDLSVIGYDDIRDAEYNNLTTINQNLFDSGVRGVQVLLDILKNEVKDPFKQNVALDLQIRNSTAPPAN